MLNSDVLVLMLGECQGCADRYGQLLRQDSSTSYQVFEVIVGEALAHYRSYPLDAILLDVACWQPDCLHLLSQVRSHLGAQAPPVVIIGDADLTAAVNAVKAGAADYLVREQITSEALCLSLRTAIENASLKQERQQREEQFQVSIENMLDCFGIFTAQRDDSGQISDFRIDYLNAAACANNQMTREQQIGRGLCEVLPNHRESGLFDEYCQLVTTGEPLLKESLVYDDRYDGQRLVRAFDIRANKLNDGFVAAWRDVTERKQLELELRQSSNHLKQLINMAPIGIAIGAADGTVKITNDAMLALHGLTRQAFNCQGMNWRDFTPPEFAGRVESAMTQLRQQGFLPPEEKELLRADGTRVPVWISATQSLDDPHEHVAFAIDLTAQKQVEADLKASQQHYQTLAEATPQIVWEADTTGMIKYWNRRWYDYTGLSEATSLGLTGLKTIHPDERDRALDLWSQAIAQGKSFEIEHRIRSHEGTYRWFINRGVPNRDAQGQLMGWIGTVTDIDDQKRLEEHLKLILQAVDSLVYDWDLQTNEVHKSEKLFDVLGFRPEEVPVTADWWNQRIHPDDKKRLQPLVEQAFIGQEDLFETKYRILHKEGHWVDVWDRSRLVRNEQGRVIRVIGSTLDISEQQTALRDRQRAEVALRQNQERLHLAMQAAGIGTWDFNIQTGEVRWSDNLQAMFGMAPGSFDGQIETVMAMIYSEDQLQVQQSLRRAIEERADYRLEFRFIKPDGTLRWALGMGRVFYDPAGTPTTMTGIDMDITERKQAELILREAHIQLQSALSAGQVYTWRWDIPANQVMVDQSFAHLFGIEAKTVMVGLPIEQFLAGIHPDDRRHVTAAIDRAIAHQEAYATEFRVRDTFGKEHWVIARGQVEFDGSGNAIAFPGALADITDRKEIEAALQAKMREAEESQQILKALMAYIPEGIIIADAPNVSIRKVSQYGQQFIERSLETLEGLTVDRHLEAWKIYYPDGVTPATADVLPLTRAVQQGEAVTNEEWMLKSPDGQSEICISCNAGPIRNTSDEITGGIVAWRDVSDLKQSELERQQFLANLAANEARLRGFVESNVVGILYGDIDGHIAEANDKFLHMIGYTRIDLGESRIRWTDLTPPEWLPMDHQMIAEAQERGACTPYEKEFIRKDGQRIPVLIGYSLVGDDREEAVAFILDLSDRKQAETALRESEDRLRIAVASAQLGTWDWNLVDNQLTWDAGCKAMFGLPPTAAPSIETFFAALHPDEHQRVRRSMQAALQPDMTANYDEEYRVIGIQDNVERWVKATGKAYFNGDGQPLRFIGVVLDITQQKQLEAQRVELLQQEQAAREAAERANRMKDEFLAILSHELRSPLNPILGWANLLRTKKMSADVTERALETIERNAKLQTQLIDDLLDVAKILRSKLKLEMAPVDPVFIIQSAIETVQPAAIAKTISIQTDLAQIGQLYGDAGRLQQVIWNLLTNAVKFTPENGRVAVCLTHNDHWAQIQVDDTGMGIHPDFLPHIFESFRQEDTSVTRKFGGLGLGLAIVRYLVEAHGGTIAADSPGEGLGSTFTVRLPLSPASPRSIPSNLPPPDAADLSGIRILVVDDNSDTLDVIEVALAQFGAEVNAYATATAALADLEQLSPHILICDIGMPEMDGYSLIEKIRSLPSEPISQVPAIALTAYARDEERQKALNHGFQQHMAKPFNPNQLAAAVADLYANLREP